MARPTAPREASAIAVRRISAVIFLRPYRPSGVILRRTTPAASMISVQAASRMASTTLASQTIREAMRGILQAPEGACGDLHALLWQDPHDRLDRRCSTTRV